MLEVMKNGAWAQAHSREGVVGVRCMGAQPCMHEGAWDPPESGMSVRYWLWGCSGSLGGPLKSRVHQEEPLSGASSPASLSE